MTDDSGTRDITTRTGLTFHVRAAEPSDEAALATFYRQITPEDMRFRFLTSLKEVGHDRLVAMTTIDHVRTENFLAFVKDETEIIGTAMLASDAALDTGEVAIAVQPAYKHKGVSWELLAHVTRHAEAKGIKNLISIQSRDHHEAITLEREMGFTAESYPDDPALVLLKRHLGTP